MQSREGGVLQKRIDVISIQFLLVSIDFVQGKDTDGDGISDDLDDGM